MRVITGTARGMKLQSFEGRDVRPTTDRVKEAMFSVIQFYIEGADVLDLFAGTGQLGIEAMSRGARSAVFVDSEKDSINIVKSNLTKTKFAGDNTEVVNTDAFAYLADCNKKFDFVFLDPPYRNGIIEKVLTKLEPVLNDEAYVFCEHEKELDLPEEIGNLKLAKKYKYGKIYVSLYRFFENN